MLIRYGYEIAVNCPQPTPMVCLLSVNEDRNADIRVAEKVFTTPIIPTTTYLDTFGNRCRRLVAPVGDFAIWGDATIEDDGKINPATLPRAKSVADLPDNCCSFSWAADMRDRKAEPDRLGSVRQHAARLGARAGGVRFRPSAHRVRLPAGAIDEKRVRSLRERIGVCRDYAHLAITFCRASTFRPATSTATSATSACRWSIRWISAPGSRYSSRGHGGRSILATMSRGSAGSWWREAGTRRTSRSSIRSDRTP